MERNKQFRTTRERSFLPLCSLALGKAVKKLPKYFHSSKTNEMKSCIMYTRS